MITQLITNRGKSQTRVSQLLIQLFFLHAKAKVNNLIPSGVEQNYHEKANAFT